MGYCTNLDVVIEGEHDTVVCYNDKSIPRLAKSRDGDVGHDLHATGIKLTHDGECVAFIENYDWSFDLHPGQVIWVTNGFRVKIRKDFELQIRPRSGLSSKKILVVNSPGTIDGNYRGEVTTILGNFSDRVFTINKNDRVSQGVFKRVYEEENLIDFNGSVDEFLAQYKTNRGQDGFGSSGK